MFVEAARSVYINSRSIFSPGLDIYPVTSVAKLLYVCTTSSVAVFNFQATTFKLNMPEKIELTFIIQCKY